jgi:hypothetical protein
MGEGFIKIHREILDHWCYQDPAIFKLWLTILLLASHKEKSAPFDGGIIELKPGMFITSRPALARRSGVHQSKINRVLKWFETEQQIEQRKTKKCRVISVLNWEKWQVGEQPNEQQTNNWRTTGEHNQERKKEINTKEKNKTKKEITLPDFISQESWDNYQDFRKSTRKGWTHLIQTKTINRLTELFHQGEDVEAVINQTIIGGWSSLHPVKNKQPQGSILDQRWKENHGRPTTQGTAAGTEGVRNQLPVLDQQTRERLGT